MKIVKHNDSLSNTRYLHGFQYYDTVLQFFHTPEGYLKNTPDENGNPSFDYVYKYKDHLGNVRVNYTQNPQAPEYLEILEEAHYYPFGLQHGNYRAERQKTARWAVLANEPACRAGKTKIDRDEALNNEKSLLDTAPPTFAFENRGYNYKFGGMELQEEFGLNLYSMDMRQYDPAIARWVVQDPITHHSMSPYNAFDNNPVFWADPSGADSEAWIKDLFNNSKSGDTWTNDGSGTFTNNRTGETSTCETCPKTKAKDGPMDGKNLQELIGFNSEGYIKRINSSVEYIDHEGVEELIMQQIDHLANTQKTLFNIAIGNIATTGVLANVKGVSTVYKVIVNGRTVAIPVQALVAAIVALEGKKLGGDTRTLFETILKYNKSGSTEGIYTAKVHSGNMLIPFSDRTNYSVYIAGSGEMIGNVEGSAAAGLKWFFD